MTQEQKIITPPIDIDKLVKQARDLYPKKEQVAAAKLLSTGSSIARPTSDADFVLWSKGDHWFNLTHLRGIPFGRIIQISGKPDSGKSTHAMSFMRFAQEQGYLVILWDAEKKFNPQRFNARIGGCSDKLLVVDTNNITDGAKGVANLVNAAKDINSNVKILIVWDSVGSSVNSSEDNDDNEDFTKQPGITARETAWAIRKFNKLANKYRNKETGEETIATLVINQTYASIGRGPPSQIEKGGGELYYLSSVIIQLTRKADLTRIKGGQKYKYGIVSKAKVKKNHLFEGNESISELEIVVSADGIHMADEIKKANDIKGWEGEDGEDGEE